MTLIKSLLLGSSATLIAVASAQAADLPTKKGAPAAEYVKVCKIGGVAGFVIPGSDTCLKISGDVRFMADFGNVTDKYTQNLTHLPTPSAANLRNSFGIGARATLGLDAASNTSMGLLSAHIGLNWDQHFGLEPAGMVDPGSYINYAYLQWAGLTAGIKPSFFDYIGGGETWNNILSPDHTGTGIPLIGYTASFGGGFAATIAAEQNAGSDGIKYGDLTFPGYAGQTTALGIQSPDFVASLDVTQGWGTAHLAGVAHNVHVQGWTGTDVNDWGYALNGGIGINLPSLGAGDVIKLQGTYTHEAINYSGLNSVGWGTGLNLNGNGLAYQIADITEGAPGVWSIPTTWGFAAVGEFHLSPQFEIAPEISYAQISWSNRGPGLTAMEGNASSWFGGAAFNYTPVTNLTFNLDIVYQDSHIDGSTAGNTPSANPSGWNGRVAVERDF